MYVMYVCMWWVGQLGDSTSISPSEEFMSELKKVHWWYIHTYIHTYIQYLHRPYVSTTFWRLNNWNCKMLTYYVYTIRTCKLINIIHTYIHWYIHTFAHRSTSRSRRGTEAKPLSRTASYHREERLGSTHTTYIISIHLTLWEDTCPSNYTSTLDRNDSTNIHATYIQYILITHTYIHTYLPPFIKVYIHTYT